MCFVNPVQSRCLLLFVFVPNAKTLQLSPFLFLGTFHGHFGGFLHVPLNNIYKQLE